MPQWIVLCAFTFGLVSGGILTALGLWVLSGIVFVLPIGLRGAILFVAVLAGTHREWGFSSFPLPENKRLVPQSVFQHRPIRAATQFGLELGTGMRTYLPSAMPYVVAVAILTHAASFAPAVLAGVGFGVGRAVMPWLRFAARRRASWDATLASRFGWIGRLSSSALLTWGIFLVVKGGDWS
jgi:hypothetical protein